MNDKKTVTIEKNVPFPPLAGALVDLPFGTMEVNDSFAIDPSYGYKESTLRVLASLANKKFNPKKFKSRNEGSGIRIWRTQ